MGETEVVYINGVADWITIEGIDHIPFGPSALTAIGIAESNPSFKDSFTLRWDNLPGFLSVSIFKGASNSDYAYIKVKTK